MPSENRYIRFRILLPSMTTTSSRCESFSVAFESRTSRPRLPTKRRMRWEGSAGGSESWRETSNNFERFGHSSGPSGPLMLFFFLSHKVARLIVPAALIAAAVCNLLLLECAVVSCAGRRPTGILRPRRPRVCLAAAPEGAPTSILFLYDQCGSVGRYVPRVARSPDASMEARVVAQLLPESALTKLDLLSWDSVQFGFPVARLHTSLDAAELADVLGVARATGIVLAYLTLPRTDEQPSTAILERYGGKPIDERVTYLADAETIAKHARHGAGPEPETRNEIAPYALAEPDDDLVRLARQSGDYSRFNTDTRIPRRVFEAIYDAWIARSVHGEIAERVLVARHDGRIVGLVTMGLAGAERGEIGLLAVDETMRGHGLGRRLAGEALRWAGERALTTAQVVTQMRNRPACALYESCGYVVHRVERTYHFWLR